MRLSTRVRYASRAMVELALSYSIRPVPGKEIAERQGISESYLENLMASLKAAGLVRTERGPRGGYLLAKPPDKIKLSHIWSALDGPISLVDCVSQPLLCPRSGDCATRAIWGQIEQAINGVIEFWTLEDMVQKSNKNTPTETHITARQTRSKA